MQHCRARHIAHESVSCTLQSIRLLNHKKNSFFTFFFWIARRLISFRITAAITWLNYSYIPPDLRLCARCKLEPKVVFAVAEKYLFFFLNKRVVLPQYTRTDLGTDDFCCWREYRVSHVRRKPFLNISTVGFKYITRWSPGNVSQCQPLIFCFGCRFRPSECRWLSGFHSKFLP